MAMILLIIWGVGAIITFLIWILLLLSFRDTRCAADLINHYAFSLTAGIHWPLIAVYLIWIGAMFGIYHIAEKLEEWIVKKDEP